MTRRREREIVFFLWDLSFANLVGLANEAISFAYDIHNTLETVIVNRK
jgi:hypothetical protein